MEAEAWIFLKERVSVQQFFRFPEPAKMSRLYCLYQEPEKSYERVNQQVALQVVVLPVGNQATKRTIEQEEDDKPGAQQADNYKEVGPFHILYSCRIVYPLNTRKRSTRIMMITIAIITFSQGIPSGSLPVLSLCDTVPYPPPVAVAVPPLPYDIPTPGAGFFFHEAIPVHSWAGGSRHFGQNAPLQCWQVKGSRHSSPQYSQRVIVQQCSFSLKLQTSTGTFLRLFKNSGVSEQDILFWEPDLRMRFIGSVPDRAEHYRDEWGRDLKNTNVFLLVKPTHRA